MNPKEKKACGKKTSRSGGYVKEEDNSSFHHREGEYMSNLILVEKRKRSHHQVINLKNLNKFALYEHFKMECLNSLKCLLKDVYFSVPLHKYLRKLNQFLLKGNLYEYLCLCFSISPAPGILSKLIKVPLAILRRLSVLTVIYLGNMLLIRRATEETIITPESIMFLLQYLVLLLSLKKSVIKTVYKTEFVSLIIHSLDIKLSLTAEKARESSRIMSESVSRKGN